MKFKQLLTTLIMLYICSNTMAMAEMLPFNYKWTNHTDKQLFIKEKGAWGGKTLDAGKNLTIPWGYLDSVSEATTIWEIYYQDKYPLERLCEVTFKIVILSDMLPTIFGKQKPAIAPFFSKATSTDDKICHGIIIIYDNIPLGDIVIKQTKSTVVK